jgi:hypothetical protein
VPSITSDPKPLKGVLTNPVRLPEYQRAAAWPSEKNMRLLDSILEWAKDTRSHQDGEHFYLGNIVTTDHRRKIVDGQQRLNSLTIISAALRDVLLQLDRTTNARKIHDKLIQKDNGKLRYTPKASKDNPTQKALETLQRPLCSFQLGKGSFSSKNAKKKGNKLAGKEPFDQKYELQLDGQPIWHLFKGDFLEIETDDGKIQVVKLDEDTKATEKNPTRSVYGSSSIDEIELVGKLSYHSRGGLDKKKEIHKSYLEIGTRLFHLLSEMTFVTKQKTQQLVKDKDIAIRLKFKGIRGPSWLTPIPYAKGHKFTLKDSAGKQQDFNTKRSSFEFNGSINIYHKPSKNQKLGVMTHAVRRSGSFQHTLTAQSTKLGEHLLDILSNIEFTVTNFKRTEDALVHFTIANDGTRMEPLYNYDLLNALTISVIDYLDAKPEKSTKDAAAKVKEHWGKISKLIYQDYLSTDIKSGLKHADDFLGRYCLSKGWLDKKNKRYQWDKGGTEIYGRIEKEMKKNSNYFDITWKAGVETFYNNLLDNAEYHELAKNPMHEVAGKHLEPDALSRILVINKKTNDIFVPLIMSMLEKKLNASKKDNSEIISKALDRVIYHLARFWVLPECIGDDDYVKISGQDFYGRYEGTNGWSTKIKDSTSTKDFEDLVNLIETDAVDPKAKKKKLKKTDWPIPKNHDLIIARSSPNSLFLVYAHQLAITNSNKLADRLLKQKKFIDGDPSKGVDKDSSDHPEVEHIIPKDWKEARKVKVSGSRKRKSWPYWKESEHAELVECIGNKTLLEYYINGHVKNYSLKFKIGEKCAVTSKQADSTKHYGCSDYDQPETIKNKRTWKPADVENRSAEMMKDICKNWK